VAEHRSFSEGKDAGELERSPRDGAVAEQVDAAVERVEACAPQFRVDGIGAEAGCDELVTGDHTMLRGCNPHHRAAQFPSASSFPDHMTGKLDAVEGAPSTRRGP
jgi:hypothetical protein